jgi:hypothetical protein
MMGENPGVLEKVVLKEQRRQVCAHRQSEGVIGIPACSVNDFWA